MKRSKLLSLAVTAAIVCTSLMGCSNEPSETNTEQTSQTGEVQQTEGDGSGETVTEKFTWWIYNAEDSTYYAVYEENPGIQYLTSKIWDTDEDGNDVKIELEFIVPIAGAEIDNYNTLLATGEYPDIIQVISSAPVLDLYEENIAMDISEYVQDYMPNYLAYLEENPDLGKTATNIVDGDLKYLQLYSYADAVGDIWCGFSYRRDWIVKYGVNPIDGSTFSGSYTETNEDGSMNMDSWEDNVVFPSGGYHPVYISDWEWMLDIFATAIEDQNITDGYCMNIPYSGYHSFGDLVSSFGGGTGGGYWCKNSDNEVIFGGTTDTFRTYLQCMNTWYANGWIDPAFPERASDMFFNVDEAGVRQGIAGLWYGSNTILGGRLDDGEGLLDGIVIFGASSPINDIYGTQSQQNKEPDMMYQGTKESGVSFVITDKAKDKNLTALFHMLDYTYSSEFAMIKEFGLTKEQNAEIQSEIYTRFDLTEGSYFPVETDEGIRYQMVDTVRLDGGSLVNAVRPIKITGLIANNLSFNADAKSRVDSMKQWMLYKNTGAFTSSFISQLSYDDSQTISALQIEIRDYVHRTVPNFIKGSLDPYSDSDWQAFVDEVNKYNPEVGTKIYQDLLDQFK